MDQLNFNKFLVQSGSFYTVSNNMQKMGVN